VAASSLNRPRIVVRRFRVPVEFHHVDLMNVVHNVQYFKWFEKGRLMIMEEVISVQWGVEHRIAAPVVRNHCEYLHTATYGDELVVSTKHRIVPEWTGKLVFEHAISNAKTKQEVCVGGGEITVVDLETHRILKQLPDQIWNRYQALA
jgi:YbgC/YbaW family acyl-CoA thioester hydrolase